jgi:hypothetical protein
MKKHLILLLTLASLLVLLLTSCNLAGVTIEARIYQFVSDLNATDRSNIYLNFHPDCRDYVEFHASDYFDSSFPPVGADPARYSIVPGTLDTSNESSVTFQLNGPTGFFSPSNIICQMEKYGNDWQIRMLWLQGMVVVQ